jgi:hypothetical protein
MKRAILTTAALAAVLFIGASAQATDNTFTGESTSYWNNGDNWDQDHIPTADENAVIPDGKTCNVDITTAVADTVEVQNGGTLNIQTGMKLTLDGDGGTSKVSGTGELRLLGSGSVLAFTTHDHAISYESTPGEITGANSSALITLAGASQSLTSNITISGQLSITEDTSSGDPMGTSFVNSDEVRANAAGTLDISVDSCSGSGNWRAETSGDAVLQFDLTNPSSLTGDFYLSSGKVKLITGTQISTSGDLAEFAADTSFELTSYASISFNQ